MTSTLDLRENPLFMLGARLGLRMQRLVPLLILIVIIGSAVVLTADPTSTTLRSTFVAFFVANI